MRSKYGAVRTTVEGITFHSKGEAKRYQELRLLERAGEISDLRRQPVFVLYAALTTGTMSGALKATTGQWPVVGKYIADFAYYDERAGRRVTEDFKGCDTPLSKWKRKHTEHQYGITVLVTGKATRR